MDFSPFNQTPPSLGNQWDDDPALRACLARILPAEVLADIEGTLREMGDLAGGELYRMQLEDRLRDPELVQWSPWGERVDTIEVTPLWKRAEVLAAEKGLVATAYERRHGRFSRVHQLALVYLFGPSSDVYACPLAMTDGAARTIVELQNASLAERALPRLTSRDPARFWTSGQWMTESTGGSDVGTSETVATRDGDGSWRLWGRKYFTSATTSQMALTLGRPEGNGPGGSGLALYYLELRDAEGRLRSIEVSRLKDKLGTRKVPTAEVMLRGTPAELVAEAKNGVRNITPMLNITRTWNTMMSAAGMRRGMALAKDFARKRAAFGAKLSEKPLHLDTLAGLEAETRGATLLAFHVGELLGRHESGDQGEHDARLLRLLTPLAKLTTGKQAVVVASEVLECFGGAGYMEDTGLPVLLRDAQVLPIWEGTTNVLALDALRALSKEPESLGALRAELETSCGGAGDAGASGAAKQALEGVDRAAAWLRSAMDAGPAAVEAGARGFALTLGRSVELALLVRQSVHAARTGDGSWAAAARRFAQNGTDALCPSRREDSEALAS